MEILLKSLLPVGSLATEHPPPAVSRLWSTVVAFGRRWCAFRVASWVIRLRVVPLWMIHFLSCHRDDKRTGRAMHLLCDRPRRRLTDIRRETSSDPGRGSITRISNNDGPQIHIVSDDIPCPTSRDVTVSRVGAVRPLETVVPLSGAALNDVRQSCSDSEASDDDMLSVGALVPMNRPAVCCAQLDDFNWVVPDCVPDIWAGHRSRIDGSDSMFPVMSAGAAAVPMPLPAVAESVPHVVIRKEAAPVVVPLAEEMTLRVVMVGLIEDGMGHSS